MAEQSSAVRPPEVPDPPRLHHLASHTLGYDADGHVGVGADNKVLVGREDTNTLQLLQVKDGAYSPVWEKACPPGVKATNRKYILDSTIITRAYDRDPTMCWDMEMARLHEHQVGKDRRLVGCLGPHVQVYREEIERDSYQLVLHGGSDVVTLRPPARSRWGYLLSVCQHAGTGWYAVCDHNNALDVFDAAGRHHHHVTLEYKPGPRDAIVSTATHVIVLEDDTVLHVHTWSGEEIATVDLKPILKLESWVRVYSLGLCDGGRTLHVAVGPDGCTVRSLHTLHVESPHAEGIKLQFLAAAERGDVERVRRLLSDQPDLVQAVNGAGQTAVHLAAGKVQSHTAGKGEVLAEAPRHTAVVSLLLDAAPKLLHAQDENQLQPVHNAAKGGHADTLAALIERGANVNAKDKDVRTPLHLAAWRGDEACVRRLLSARADKSIKDENGNTAYDVAVAKKHSLIAELLKVCDAPGSSASAPRPSTKHLEFDLSLYEMKQNHSDALESIDFRLGLQVDVTFLNYFDKDILILEEREIIMAEVTSVGKNVKFADTLALRTSSVIRVLIKALCKTAQAHLAKLVDLDETKDWLAKEADEVEKLGKSMNKDLDEFKSKIQQALGRRNNRKEYQDLLEQLEEKKKNVDKTCRQAKLYGRYIEDCCPDNTMKAEKLKALHEELEKKIQSIENGLDEQFFNKASLDKSIKDMLLDHRKKQRNNERQLLNKNEALRNNEQRLLNENQALRNHVQTLKSEKEEMRSDNQKLTNKIEEMRKNEQRLLNEIERQRCNENKLNKENGHLKHQSEATLLSLKHCTADMQERLTELMGWEGRQEAWMANMKASNEQLRDSFFHQLESDRASLVTSVHDAVMSGIKAADDRRPKSASLEQPHVDMDRRIGELEWRLDEMASREDSLQTEVWRPNEQLTERERSETAERPAQLQAAGTSPHAISSSTSNRFFRFADHSYMVPGNVRLHLCHSDNSKRLIDNMKPDAVLRCLESDCHADIEVIKVDARGWEEILVGVEQADKRRCSSVVVWTWWPYNVNLSIRPLLDCLCHTRSLKDVCVVRYDLMRMWQEECDKNPQVEKIP